MDVQKLLLHSSFVSADGAATMAKSNDGKSAFPYPARK